MDPADDVTVWRSAIASRSSASPTGKLLEVLQATEIFEKNNVYTGGLQLGAGLWAEQD